MRDIDLLRIIKRVAYKIIAKDKDSAVIANDFMNRFKGTDLFLKKFKLGKKETIYLFITNFVKIIYKLILSIGFSINSAIYKKREQNLKKNEVLIVSQIISINQNKNRDIYFGGISKILKKKKINFTKIYINNLGLRFIKKKFKDLENQNNFVINTNVSFLILIQIYSRLLQKFIKYFISSFNKNLSLKESQVIRVLSLEFLNIQSINNLIIENKLKKILTSNKPKNLVCSYEGFSWEKMVFQAARKKSPKTKIIGYQFASLTKDQILTSSLLKKKYAPDIIWTAGNVNKLRLGIKNSEIIVVGTDRNKNLKNKKNKKNNYCLVLPEGIDDEIKKIMNFSIKCAKNFPKIRFIWRFHPSIIIKRIISKISKAKLPTNIEISKKNLSIDITRSSFFIYRGSTSAITALQNGLYPIYLNLNQTINIDPLYEFTNWKSVINSEADFNYLIDNELKKVFSQNKNIKIGKKYSEQYFTKLKPISIYRSLAL